MQTNGWLQDPKTKNTKRFHQDEKSWPIYPKVFIDSGRPLSNEDALVNNRSYVDVCEASKQWEELRNEGWEMVAPQWAADLDV